MIELLVILCLSFFEMKQMITDGSNDGGADYIFYDDDTPKVIMAQSKWSKNIDNNAIISELNKMCSTVHSFLEGNTGSFNNVKRELQNELDRLPDESIGSLKLYLQSQQ